MKVFLSSHFQAWARSWWIRQNNVCYIGSRQSGEYGKYAAFGVYPPMSLNLSFAGKYQAMCASGRAYA